MNGATEKENKLTLELLDAIQEQDDISQRHLAEQMGVALGLANAYLKRCVKKGLVKINSAPANRYLYYLTPQGFAEKARLTAQFLSTSLALVREARADYQQLFERLRDQGRQNVLLVGVSDLTEIAYLRALQTDVALLAIWQPNAQVDQFFNYPVLSTDQQLREIIDSGKVDAVVLTSMEQTNQLVSRLANFLPQDQVVLPDFLINLTYRVELLDQPIISEEST